MVVAVLLIGVSCGGPRYEYPDSAINFMNEGCSECACVHRAIQDNIPYEDWHRFTFENATLQQSERQRINAVLNRLNNACGNSGMAPAPDRS